MNGSRYGFADAPFDTRTIDTFASHSGKSPSIVHWGQPWYWGSRGGYQPFQRTEVEKVRLRGSIPMITWTSTDHDLGGSVNQGNFQLGDIIGGRHDAYLRQWADSAKAWGYPLFVRFDNEMNGNWFAWSEKKNGNSSGQFVQMWRHVVDIFRQEGATNVTWVWAPNRTWDTAPLSLSSVYPGSSYVDWVGMSGYNWGTNPAKPGNTWQDFDEVFKETYDDLRSLASGKPMMIGETASTEWGGSKAAWIKDALTTQLPSFYPQIKALVWFNWDVAATSGDMDWPIESSSSAQAAFRAAIGSGYYAANTFSSLPKLSKIQPLGSAGASVGPPELVRNGSFETGGLDPVYAPWTVRNDLRATVSRDVTTAGVGSASLRVTLPSASSTVPWAVQVRETGLPLTGSATYTLSFWAKASTARATAVTIQASTSPWRVYAERHPALATSWAKYTYAFTAPSSDSSATVAFNVAQDIGTVWLDGVSLVAG